MPQLRGFPFTLRITVTWSAILRSQKLDSAKWRVGLVHDVQGKQTVSNASHRPTRPIQGNVSL